MRSCWITGEYKSIVHSLDFCCKGKWISLFVVNLALYHQYKIHHLDFNNVILNGELKNPACIRVPNGIKIYSKYSNPVLKISKVLYGLRESPKEWNTTLNSILLLIDFESCKLVVYVDDILIIGQDEDVNKKLKYIFQCPDLCIATSFLVLNIYYGMEADSLGLVRKV